MSVKIQIIMHGSNDIPLMEDAKNDISAFCAVLNFKSKKPFMYYCTDSSVQDVIQDAVKSADKHITHILYLGKNVVLEDIDYDFADEKEYDVVCDDLSYDKCKFCLVKVNTKTRLNFSKDTLTKEMSCKLPLFNEYTDISSVMTKLLERGSNFNFDVQTIRQLNTKREREKKPRIMIGTPCFGGQVYCNYTSSLIKTLDLLRENGIDYEVHFLPNQIVTRARNILAYEFLSGNFTHLLFIDADIEWKPEDVLKLINHKKELVVGLYANKSYIIVESNNFFKKIQYSSTFFPENNIMDKNKLMEIKHGATGFMLIERCVFEKVIDLAPEFKYSSHTMNDFFPCKVVDGDYLTEDYAFCQMWREKGGKIWADLSICLNHEGWHSYHGNPLKTFEVTN